MIGLIERLTGLNINTIILIVVSVILILIYFKLKKRGGNNWRI